LKKGILVLFLITLSLFLITSCDSSETKEPVIDLNCRVSFVYGNDLETDVIWVKKGDKIIAPSKTLVDHELIGYFIDEEMLIPFDFTIPITASITLYAKWRYIEPVIIKPKKVKIDSTLELSKIDEISKMLTNANNFEKSFDYYIIKGKIISILDEEKGVLSVLVLDKAKSTNLVVTLNPSLLKELNLQVNDEITFTSVITYLDGLRAENVTIANVDYSDHFITCIVGENSFKYLISEVKTILDLVDPVITDYLFLGWYFDEDYLDKIDDSYEFKKDITIYAKIEVIPHFFVTIHLDTLVTKKYYEPFSINEFLSPSKEDYEFLGWCFDEELENLVPSDYIISTDCELFPKFEKINYFYITIHTQTTQVLKLRDPYDVSNLKAPEVTDYEFLGWYFDSEFLNPVPKVGEITTTCDIYPLYKKIPYYFVNFHILDDVITHKLLGENSLDSFDKPNIDDYTFMGWYFDSEFKNKIPDNFVLNSDLDVFANLVPIPYIYITVNYENSVEEYRFISEVSLIDVVSRYQTIKEGYEFMGWFSDSAYYTELSLDTIFISDATIYAYFRKIMHYTVTFIVDGEKNFLEVLEKTSLKENGVKSPTKEDYAFVGWYKDEKYSELMNIDELINEDLTLYAKFVYAPVNYNVTIIIGGDTVVKSYPKYTKISQVIPEKREDFTFDGWYKDNAFSTKFEAEALVLSDITIYGRYIPITYYKVFVNVLDDVKTIEKIKENTTFKQILENVNIEGYRFLGWYKDSSFDEILDLNEVITKDVSVFARLEKINYYIIRTNILGSVTEYKDIIEGTVLSTIIKNPALSGYRFIGWYKDSEFLEPEDMSVGINSDLLLFGKFEKINYYTITCNILDDTTSYSDLIEGTIISTVIKDPVITDYIFEGWYSDATFNTPFDIKQKLTSNITLYAKLKKINYYTVTKIIKTTTDVVLKQETVSIKEGTSFSSIAPNLTFDDYYFLGWYTDASFLTLLDKTEKVYADVTIYGKIVEIPYHTVIVYIDDNKISYSVKDKSSISSIKIPVKASDDYGTYKFSSWYTDSSLTKKISNTTIITSDLTLYAGFSVVRNYFIKIYSNNNLIKELKLTDATNSLSKLGVLEGYKDDDFKYNFLGYSMSASGDVLSDDFKFSDTYTTLYAIYEKIPYINVLIKYLNSEKVEKVLKGTRLLEVASINLDSYKFMGWFSDLSYQHELKLDFIIDSDLTIYANMLKIIKVTQIVNLKSSTTTVLENDKIDKISIPNFVDYEFLGWYFDEGLTKRVPLDYTFKEDVTLYASLRQVPYYKVFIYNDTTTKYGLTKYITIDVREKTSLKDVIEKLNIPSVAGYTFSKWCLDDELLIDVDMGSIITSDVSLYAAFTPNTNTSYTVKYWLKGDLSYSLITSKVFYGTTKEEVTPEYQDVYDSLENKDYYVLKNVPKGIIKGDGTTQIDVYFDRQSYTIKYYIGDTVCYESEKIVWGEPVEFLTNMAFTSLVGEAFISGWYKYRDLTGDVDYTVMIPGGISIYGDVELIYKGTEGIIYELNETEDAYIVTGYNGDEEIVIIANGYNGLPVTKIDKSAFYKKSVVRLEMSNHITEISDLAFFGCCNLTTITLSKNIEIIGDMCFGECSALESLSFTGALKTLGEEAFKGCKSITKIDMGENTNYLAIDNALYTSDLKSLIYYFSGTTSTTFTLPSETKVILSNAFSNASNLTLISTSNVEVINSNAIYKCDSLKKIIIGKSAVVLSQNFIECLPNLESITVESENQNYLSVDDVLYNKDQTILYYYPSKKLGDTFIIPETVRSIEYKAFQYNDLIKSLVLDQNIKKVAYLGFYMCNNLTITCKFTTIPKRFNQVWYEGIKNVIYN